MTRILLKKWHGTLPCRSVASRVAEGKPVFRHVDGGLHQILPGHLAVFFPRFVEPLHLTGYPSSRRTCSIEKQRTNFADLLTFVRGAVEPSYYPFFTNSSFLKINISTKSMKMSVISLGISQRRDTPKMGQKRDNEERSEAKT